MVHREKPSRTGTVLKPGGPGNPKWKAGKVAVEEVRHVCLGSMAGEGDHFLSIFLDPANRCLA